MSNRLMESIVNVYRTDGGEDAQDKYISRDLQISPRVKTLQKLNLILFLNVKVHFNK